MASKKPKAKPKPSWSCIKCGATTTDPTQALITYFHLDCIGK